MGEVQQDYTAENPQNKNNHQLWCCNRIGRGLLVNESLQQSGVRCLFVECPYFSLQVLLTPRHIYSLRIDFLIQPICFLLFFDDKV